MILKLNNLLNFRCLIFASDGLWNVIDPETAVDSIYESERRNEHNSKLGVSTWRNPSRVLVETALEKWRNNNARADNTSVVCVMLDEPNKRNMFKFCRQTPANEYFSNEMEVGSRTIFDYSTSEAYNLDYMSSDVYNQNLQMPSGNPPHNLYGEGHSQFYEKNFDQQNYVTNYKGYETSYGYQMASTSSQHIEPAPVTYQTTSNESAFVKACCRNNYQLASRNEQIPYHSSYEQHRAMYEDMALRPYPPLHYAYRPVPTLPLPSLHANLYDHQGYQSNYRPMERYNYLRPTPEEVAAMHNEEDEDSDSNTTIEFSDEESDQEETKEEKNEVEKSSEDSIQIFEISSSSLNEIEKMAVDDSGNSNDEAGKPTKSNNKENTEASIRKKKETPSTSGRFYATRQFDRKMRSGNVGSSGVTKTIGREKSQRLMSKNIRKILKTFVQSDTLKPSGTTSTTQAAATRLSKKAPTKTIETKPVEKRVLRRAPVKEADSTIKKPVDITIVRSLRSNSNNSNVMEKLPAKKRGTFASIDRNRERRIK